MKYFILTAKRTKESDLCRDFLDWQDRAHQIEITNAALVHAKGTLQPVIMQNGEPIAIGFVALVEHFNKNGLLCLANIPHHPRQPGAGVDNNQNL